MKREPYTMQNTNAAEEHPNKQTCGDCAHFPRCRWLLSRMEEDRICDWDPSRFAVNITGA